MIKRVGLSLLIFWTSLAWGQSNRGGYIGYVPAVECRSVQVSRNGKPVDCNGTVLLYFNDVLHFNHKVKDSRSLLHLRSDVTATPDKHGVTTLLHKVDPKKGWLDEFKVCADYLTKSLYDRASSIPAPPTASSVAWPTASQNQIPVSATTRRSAPASTNFTKMYVPPDGSSIFIQQKLMLRWPEARYADFRIYDTTGQFIYRMGVKDRISAALSPSDIPLDPDKAYYWCLTDGKDSVRFAIRTLGTEWENRVETALAEPSIVGLSQNLRAAVAYQAISDASNGQVNLYWKSYDELESKLPSNPDEASLRNKLMARYEDFMSVTHE